MIEVRDLRLVEAIHENGSLIRAARVLGVAQPALTRSLAVLEAKLGGQLFERNHRGVIATNLARAILAESAAILESVEKLNRQIGEVRGAQKQDLSVIAGGYIMDSLCITAAAHMLSLFPQVRLRLLTANWSEVPRAVLEREVPIGLADLRGLVLDPSLAVEKLRPHPVIVVARPGHPLALRAKVALPDIMAFPLAFIGRSPSELHKPLAAAREAARGQGDIHPSFPAVTHESPKVMLHLLRQSDAVMGLPVSLAMEPIARGEVVALRWREAWSTMHSGIITLQSRALGAAEQGFLDLLRAANEKAEAEAMAWCEAQGIPSACA